MSRPFSLTLLALLLILAPIATGCEENKGSSSASNWSSIKPDRAAAMIETGSVDLILDVRTPAEFASGALPNAVNISVDSLASQIDKVARYKDKTVLVYCRSGNRSVTASKYLASQGFEHVLNMLGGTTSWQAKRLPLVK